MLCGKIFSRQNMLELKNINYTVNVNGEQKQILKNISFCVNDGENLVITGHNGSGKSTLLKIIMGIVKATSGEIYFNGKEITNLSIDEHAHLGIAFSFQTPICFKGMTVKKMLEIATENKGNFNDYCNVLSKLGLCARDYLNREINNKLSGGEQKRIEIASVLCRNASLNLFDEPEAGIDIWSFDKLTNIFSELKSTNIIVSHQQKLMQKADKILLLNGGEIEVFDKTEKVLNKIKNTSCQKLNSSSEN